MAQRRSQQIPLLLAILLVVGCIEPPVIIIAAGLIVTAVFADAE